MHRKVQIASSPGEKAFLSVLTGRRIPAYGRGWAPGRRSLGTSDGSTRFLLTISRRWKTPARWTSSGWQKPAGDSVQSAAVNFPHGDCEYLPLVISHLQVAVINSRTDRYDAFVPDRHYVCPVAGNPLAGSELRFGLVSKTVAHADGEFFREVCITELCLNGFLVSHCGFIEYLSYAATPKPLAARPRHPFCNASPSRVRQCGKG